MARARRTALALLAVTPVVLALWAAAARSRQTTGAIRLFDSPADHIAAGLLIGSVIVCGTLTVITHHHPAPSPGHPRTSVNDFQNTF